MPKSLLLAVLLAPFFLAGAGPGKGQEFADFTATDALTGQEFSLHDLRGKVVLIDFWATWCGPCVKELPNVKRAYARYREQGLEIVSISLDEDRKRFESFVRQRGMSWHHVMEGGGWSTRLARQYGVSSIPRMIVVDPNGVCVADGVRGRKLDEVIQASLGKVKRSERPSAAPEPDASPGPSALQSELEALREQLAETAVPLKEAADALLAIDEQVSGLQSGTRSSDDPLAQQLAALIERLRGIRQALFMLGLIDEHNPVALPMDPPGAAGDPWPADRIAGVLESLHRSIRTMQALVEGASVQRAALETRVAELQQQATGKGVSARAVESRLESLRVETDALAERFGGSWSDRVAAMQPLIAAAGKALASAEASMAELEPGLRSLARTADAARNPGPRQALREAFNAARKKLVEAAALAGAGDAVALPSDPFEGRTLKDSGAVAELKVQIRVATSAAAALHGKLAAQRRGVKALAAEDESLRGEIARRVKSGAPLEDLEERFTELSLKVLALGDPG